MGLDRIMTFPDLEMLKWLCNNCCCHCETRVVEFLCYNYAGLKNGEMKTETKMMNDIWVAEVI